MPKTRIGAFLRLENRSYDGTSFDDDYYGYGLRAHYKPWTGGDIALTVQRAARDSSVPNREFRATAISLTATLAF